MRTFIVLFGLALLSAASIANANDDCYVITHFCDNGTEVMGCATSCHDSDAYPTCTDAGDEACQGFDNKGVVYSSCTC
jgi:hypothetical protein